MFLVLISIPAVTLLSLQNKKIQTQLAQYAARELSESLDTKIDIEEVSVTFFNRFLLKNLYLEDQNGDTLILSEKVKVTLSRFGRSDNEIVIKRINFSGAKIHLITSKEDGINFQFIIDKIKNQPKKKPEKEKKQITFRNIEIRDSGFRLSNTEKKARDKNTINFTDMVLSDLNLKVNDLEIHGDTVDFFINALSFQERSGFLVENYSSRFHLTKQDLHFNNVRIKTPLSSISATEIHFDFSGFPDFSDVFNKVNIRFNFRSTSVNFGDIGYFTASLEDYYETVRLSGLFTGTLSEMSTDKVLLAYNQETILGGSFNLIGLPDIQETFMHFDIDLFQTSMQDLDQLPLPSGKRVAIPEKLFKLGTISYEGKFTGYYDDFVAYGNFQTDVGSISTDVLIKPDTLGGVNYTGRIKSPDFNLGEMTDHQNIIGDISFSANADGSIYKNNISANLKSWVDSLEIYDYKYRNVRISGFLSDKKFDGNLDIKDPNITMDFTGRVDFSAKQPSFRFTADVSALRPYFLNVNKTDPTYFATFLVKSDFSGLHPDSINGSINLVNSFFINSREQIQIYDFSLLAKNDKDSSQLIVRSDVVDADLHGRFSYSTLMQSFENLGSLYVPSLFDSPSVKNAATHSNNAFTLNADFKKFENVLNFFLPDIIIADKSTLSTHYSDSNHSASFSAFFPEIKYKNSSWENLNITAESDSLNFNACGESDVFFLGEDLNLANLKLLLKAENDSLYTGLTWDNLQSPTYSGEIDMATAISVNKESGKHKFTIQSLPSWFYFNDTLWDISSALIRIDSSYVGVDSLSISNARQALLLNGEISKTENAVLRMSFKELDMSTFNVFTENKGLRLSGNLNGNASLLNAYTRPLFLSNLKMNDLIINNQDFGTGELSAAWDNDSRGIHMIASGVKADTEILRAEGDFFPEQGDISFQLDFDKIQLSTFEPFASKLVSDMKGLGSGNFKINGSLQKPEVFGILSTNKASLIVNYLQTRYSFTDQIRLIDNNIVLKDFEITDENGSVAVANGMISNNHFKDFNIDLSISSPDFLFLNTSQADNELFYGRVLASGLVNINGPPENLMLNIDATTGRNSVFSIPLNGTEEVNEIDFVRFVNSEGYDNEVKEQLNYAVNTRGLNMNFNLEITPDALVQLIFDPKLGDILRGRGNGNLNIIIDATGNFEMYGDMVIEEGDYLFTLQNLFNKKLEVKPGGRIVFNGDPSDANIDLKAVYSLRTSVYPLSPESGDELKKRIPVECHINMTGKLMEPTIATDIVLPTADQQTINIVNSTINTEEEKLKQFISLLVINNFMSIDPGSSFLSNQGNTGSANLAGVATSELLSNQLSHWLSQISRDFDIGLNYRPGDQITNDELEVALSTQIFDDRITINGNLGVGGTETTPASSATNTNNIVGDFDVDFKITETGKLHLKAFNRANDNLLFQTSPYTQGVGVFYREEFNSFGELVRRYFNNLAAIFSPTKKKEKQNK